MTTQTTTYNEHRNATPAELEAFRDALNHWHDTAVFLMAETAQYQLARGEFATAAQRTACELVIEEAQYRRAEDAALATEATV